MTDPIDAFGIQQVIARYGHAIDSAPHELGAVFAAEVVHDARLAGGPLTSGLEELLRILVGASDVPDRPSPRPAAPRVSHHITNVEVLEVRGDAASARSKYLRLGASGVAFGQMADRLVKREGAWLIAHRTIVPYG